MGNSGGMWKDANVSAPFAIQLACTRNFSQYSLHKRNASKLARFATLLACQQGLQKFCNTACMFFLQRSLRMFFATALACFFLQPKLRGLGRMATCAGVGFSRTVNYFFLPVFFCLTNSTGCCIITVPIRENPIRASTEIGMCRVFYTCFS